MPGAMNIASPRCEDDVVQEQSDQDARVLGVLLHECLGLREDADALARDGVAVQVVASPLRLRGDATAARSQRLPLRARPGGP
jgi:hypothetical protein